MTKQLLCAYSRAGQGGADLGREDWTECWEKKGQSQREAMKPRETALKTLSSKPQPRGNTQITRNGLN